MTKDSVEDVYRSDHDRLQRALLAQIGDPEVAADAEAEAFRQVIARGAEVRDVRAWVWTAAFKIARGLLTTQSRERSSAALRADVVGSAEPLVDFLDQLQTLSEQQRAVVVLRYVGGFTPTEISQILGTTPGTVRVQLHRAHGRLREDLT